MVLILSALWWIRIQGLWKLSDGRGWLSGKLGLFLVSGAMLSKSNFLLMSEAVFPQCCLTWDQTMVGIMKIMATSFKMTCARTVFSAPDPVDPCLHQTPGHSQAGLAQPLMRMLLLFPGSWHTQDFICALQESVFPVFGSSVIKSHWPPKSNSLGPLSPFAGSHWEVCCGS